MTRTPPGSELEVSLSEVSRAPLDFLEGMVAKYGNVTRHITDGRPVTIVNEPDLVSEIFISKRLNFVKTGTPDELMLVPLLGRGLLTTEGEVWREQRTIAQPAFQHREILRFAPLMINEADRMIDQWLSGTDQVRLDRDLTSLTLTIVARSLLGSDVVIGSRFGEAVDDANRFMGHYGVGEIGLQGDRHRFGTARQFIDQIVNLLINAAKLDNENRQDFLARLVIESDESRPDGFSSQEIRDQVVTMLMAGHETTAKSLTWTLWLLGQHPDVARRAQAEVDSVLGGDLPGADAYEHLPFLKAVFNEGLRLYPPVWLISRRAVEADTLGQFEIPKDSLVCISPWLLHRRNDLWVDADQFRPDRFMIDSDRHQCSFLPFSAGPRQCIGQHFATLEGVLVLARILQKVVIRIDPDHLVEPEALVTLRPRNGVLASIRARSDQ